MLVSPDRCTLWFPTHLNDIFDFKRQLSACVQHLQVVSYNFDGPRRQVLGANAAKPTLHKGICIANSHLSFLQLQEGVCSLTRGCFNDPPSCVHEDSSVLWFSVLWWFSVTHTNRLTAFSWPSGLRATVPVTLMTDSTVRSPRVSFNRH